MNQTITWVIAYDISDDRIRDKFARYLEKQAARIQKSLFEARLTEKAAKNLYKNLVRRLDTGDSLRMYALPRAALELSMAHGGAPLPEDGNFWLL